MKDVILTIIVLLAATILNTLTGINLYDILTDKEKPSVTTALLGLWVLTEISFIIWVTQ
jgi:uncharacterized protein HemY